MLQKLIARLKSPRLWRFGLVGFSGVFVNLGMLWLFADVLDLQEVVASAAAIEISIIWNFLLNNAWTFRDRNDDARSGFLSRMLTYNVVSLVGLAIQLGTFIAVSTAIKRSMGLEEVGVWKYPAQLAGIAIAMGWNFLSNFYFTWAQRKSD